MAQRNFSNNAVETQLVVPVSDTAGSFVVSSVSGWPAPPFSILVDPDDPSEESCLVTFISGTTLTVTRGYDSTVALPHSAGAVIKHAATAADFREANLHVNAVDAVHGVLGDIVGTSDVQTLTNKSISGSNNTISDIAQSAVTGLSGSLAAKANLDGGNTFTGTQNLPSTTSIGSVSSTEISYIDGLTSNAQSQIDTLGTLVNTKAPINSPTFTGNVTLPSSTTIGTVSAGEIAALDGVTGNIQSQINGITGGGVAVPAGGLTDQVLVKLSNADYDMTWRSISDIVYVPGSGSGDEVVADGQIIGGVKTQWTDPNTGLVYNIHTFSYNNAYTWGVSTDFLLCNSPVVGTLLVVAGGGAGGRGIVTSYGAGGGGGGGVYYGAYAFGTGQHNLLVGAGGASNSANGGDSRFDDMIIKGGGGGAPGNGTALAGGSGGGGAGTTGGGNPGGAIDYGSGYLAQFHYGSVGVAGTLAASGAGGSSGLTTSMFGGVSQTFAQGGAGAGLGSGAGTAGANGTGNGGGGSGTNIDGAIGGHGIIKVRYRIA